MKILASICLATLLFVLSGCGVGSAKKELDKKTQEAYNLNRELLELQQRGRQSERLVEQDIANKQRLLDDIEFQQQRRESVISGFFGNIFGGPRGAQKEVSTPPGRQESVIDRYELIYKALHERQADEFDDLRGDSLLLDSTVYGTGSLLGSTHVFGWHPYWMNGAYKGYNFRLLSTLSFFAYDVDPFTGKYRDSTVIQEWKTSSIVDSTQKYGCNMLLTISNHGQINNRIFLNDRVAQETLIDSIVFLIGFRKANGVDIDFENVPPDARKGLNDFVERLSNRLRTINNDYIISLCLPSNDIADAYDIRTLDKYVDFFVIMGYDYHGASSSVAGPVAPLNEGKIWQKGSLAGSISSYLTKKVPRGKMILALPYYGTLWSTQTKLKGSFVEQFVEHLTLKEIMYEYPLQDAGYDEVSHSRYILIDGPGAGESQQLWYDDSLTLSVKMEYIQQQGIGGVGIWALGYDNGVPQLWSLIGEKFSKDKRGLLQAARDRRRFGIIGWVRMYKSPLIAAAFFVLMFLVLGFFLSLNDWRVRDALFYSGSSRTIYAGIFFILAVSILSFTGKFPNKSLILAGGLFLGLALTMVVSRIVIVRRRELP